MRQAIAVAAALAAGCGLSAFEERRDEAWSDSNGRPPGISSADYALAVDSVSTELPGANIVVLGADPPALTTLSYDELGDRTQSGVALTEAPTSPPVLSGARDVVTGVVGLVALAVPGAIALFDVRSGAQGPELRGAIEAADCGADPGGFTAIAIAPTDAGDPEAPDLIAAAGSDLIIVVDVDPGGEVSCSRCRLDAGATAMALVAADVGDPEGDEVVIAVGSGGPASLIVLSGTQIAAGGDSCTASPPLIELEAPAGEVDFAARLASGDVDADDLPDLAATADGGARVYAIRDVEIGAEPFEVAPINAIGDSGEFGAALELVDLDGDERDEIVIGDPGASPENIASAGAAYVFSVSDDEGPDVSGILFDSTPVAGQRFGRSLSLAEFVAPPEDTDLLIVGASGEVFTYFRSLFAGEDPR